MRSSHDTRHRGARQVTPDARCTLPSPIDALTVAQDKPTGETAIQRIPLVRLGLPPDGRRRINPQSIHALADRIDATGQVQSLMVVPGEGSQYWVVAGDRRFAALLLLAGQGRIAPTFGVPCRVINAKVITETDAFTGSASAADHFGQDERRRRFADLLHQCPGVLTGSELAARRP